MTDNLRRVSLDALRTAALSPPLLPLVAGCGGVDALVEAAAETAGTPGDADLSLTLCLSLVRLMADPSARRYVRPGPVLAAVLVPFTCAVADPAPAAAAAPAARARRAASRHLLVSLARTWVGLLALASDAHALPSLLALPAQSPPLPARVALAALATVLELLCPPAAAQAEGIYPLMGVTAAAGGGGGGGSAAAGRRRRTSGASSSAAAGGGLGVGTAFSSPGAMPPQPFLGAGVLADEASAQALALAAGAAACRQRAAATSAASAAAISHRRGFGGLGGSAVSVTGGAAASGAAGGSGPNTHRQPAASDADSHVGMASTLDLGDRDSRDRDRDRDRDGAASVATAGHSTVAGAGAGGGDDKDKDDAAGPQAAANASQPPRPAGFAAPYFASAVRHEASDDAPELYASFWAHV
jgi:hypothetical protein